MNYKIHVGSLNEQDNNNIDIGENNNKRKRSS